MTSTDDTAPATKADIRSLTQRLDRHDDQFVRIHEKLDQHNRQFEQINEKLTQHDAQFELLLKHIEDKSKEVMRHFDVVAEQLKHDFQDIFHDRLEQHADRIHNLDDRLTRVERHLQLS